MERDIEVESNYIENWKEVVENSDGSINKEQIKKELADFSLMLREVPTVYMEVTGGLLSKPNYFADSVISAYNERQERLEIEAIEDYKESLDSQTLYAIRDKVSGEYIVERYNRGLALNNKPEITYTSEEKAKDWLRWYQKYRYEIRGDFTLDNLEIVRLDITPTPIKEGEEDDKPREE